MVQAMTPEQYALVLKLLVRNTDNIDVVFGVINDYACLIEGQLERCARTDCPDAATVKNSGLGIKMCDACAATTIVRAAHNISTDHRDELNLFRALVANDELWVDLPNAVRIRRLTDYARMLKKDDEPNPPEDFNELH